MTLALAGYRAHARSRAFLRRLDEARDIVAQFLRESVRPYVAFSTGKDSTVCLALAREQRQNIPAVYIDAGCAFPESVALLDQTSHVVRWRCSSFLDILAAAGGPDGARVEYATMRDTVWVPVRTVIRAHHFDGGVVGLRAAESRERGQLIRHRGLLFRSAQYDQAWEALPVGHWSDDDVWAYIHSTGTPYNRAYDRMLGVPRRQQRISYWAGETGRRKGRWEWLRREYPDLWNQFSRRFPEVAWFA